MNQYVKVTPVNDLPNLDDLEMMDNQYSPVVPKPFSGGVRGASITSSRYPGTSMIPEEQADKFDKFIRSGHRIPTEAGMNNQSFNGSETKPLIQDNDNIYNISPSMYTLPQNSPSCLDFANHHAICPICSKFYNNDKTLYILTIVILALMCILLLKKVLDV